jgi:hypothetical protein
VFLVSSETVGIDVEAEKLNYVSYLCLMIRMQDKVAT